MDKAFRLVFLTIGLILVAFTVESVTSTKFQVLKERSGYYHQDIVSAKEREKQLDCLAINIYREAGHEDFEGKVGVAQVVMNRVGHPGFPKDICGVVYQKNIVMEKVVCQFSWHCEGKNNVKTVNKAAYEESYEVAKKVLLEKFRLDILGNAIYYHADYVNPKWNKEFIVKIGHHKFYSDKEKVVNRYAKL